MAAICALSAQPSSGAARRRNEVRLMVEAGDLRARRLGHRVRSAKKNASIRLFRQDSEL